MALINIQNLTFEYTGSLTPLFKDVNLKLDTMWKLGFVGRNGYGKTTFLKLLMKMYPYYGTISVPCQLAYFPFTIHTTRKQTLEILEELRPNLFLWKLQKELQLLEVSDEVLYRSFETLSGGEQTKVLLALLFSTEERFLLIDEPTNHLDTVGRDVVARYLNKKTGFILVSHDRDFINQIVDYILSIEKNKIVLQKGNFDTWEHNKKLEDTLELEENQKLRKEIRRLKQSAREKSIWSDKVEATKIGFGPVDRGYIGHMAAKMMKRSKSIEKRYEKAIEDKEKLLRNIETIDKLQMNVLDHHAKPYVHAEDFSIVYNDQRVFHPIQFTVQKGDCLVLKGGNGSGKTSIIKSILGKDINNQGTLDVAYGLTISYLPQTFDYIQGNLTQFIHSSHVNKTKFLTILRKLGFSREQFDLPMENFSMGQKKKVFIAQSPCEEAHLFIWDEPLNYIDVISRIQIETLILEYSPTMIIVEHDKRFIDSIATDVVGLIKNE